MQKKKHVKTAGIQKIGKEIKVKKFNLNRVVIMTLVALSLSVGFFPCRTLAARMKEGSSETYRIERGDTLSRIALHACGNSLQWKNIAKKNDIADPDRIYVGGRIIIPCQKERPEPTNLDVLDGTPSKLMARYSVRTETATAIDPAPLSATPSFTLSATSAMILSPTPRLLTVAGQPQRTLLPSPTSPQKKAKPVTGYRLVIPHAVAFQDDGKSIIPLKADLATEVDIFKNADDPAKNVPPEEILHVISRAQVKGKNKDVVLNISLKQLPASPFTFKIDGVDAPLNGAVLTSQAEPFRGRFPGQPSKAKAVMFTIVRIGVSGTIMSFTMFGGTPLGYPVAVAAWAIPAAIHHHQESVDKKNATALLNANAKLAAAKAAVLSFQGGS
jgi:hypothetical protein